MIQGYTGIAAADSKAQVIVCAQAHGTDYEGEVFPGILENLHNTMKEITGKEAPLTEAVVLADTNYSGEGNLQAAEERGKEALIPDTQFRVRDERFAGRRAPKKKTRFTLEDFKYNKLNNWNKRAINKICIQHNYKQRAVAYKQAGHTFKQLGEAFGIPSETYYQWKEKRESGYYEITIRRERKQKIDKKPLRQAVADRSDAFLAEYAEPFGCTATAVFYALKNLGITRKKVVQLFRKNCGASGEIYRADKAGFSW